MDIVNPIRAEEQDGFSINISKVHAHCLSHHAINSIFASIVCALDSVRANCLWGIVTTCLHSPGEDICKALGVGHYRGCIYFSSMYNFVD